MDYRKYDHESDNLISQYLDAGNSVGNRNSAATKLFNKHRKFVIKRIEKRMGRGEESVLDISQNVWIALLNVDSLRKYQPQGRFRGYITRNIDFKVGDWFKQRHNKVKVEEYDSKRGVDDSAETPFSHFENQSNVDKLRSILGRISDSLRVVILLECYGYIYPTKPTTQEVAQVLGIGAEETESIISSINLRKMSDFTDKEKAAYISLEYDSIFIDEGIQKTPSEILGISPGSHRARLKRARDYIRECI